MRLHFRCYKALDGTEPQAPEPERCQHRCPSRITRCVALGALWVVASGTLSAQNTIAISPDGHWVAYVVRDTLHLAAADGRSAPTVIAEVETEYTLPRWCPRSDRLTYYSAASGSTQLWLYDLGTRVHQRLTDVKGGIAPDPLGRLFGWGGDAATYGWSPDGATIAFVNQVPVGDTLQPSGANAALRRPAAPESIATGRPLVLTGTTPPNWTLQGVLRYHSGPAFKNGKWAEIDDAEARPRLATQLFLVDVKTGHVRQLTSDTAGYFTPDWSPDGRHLAYMSPEGRSLAAYGPEETNIYVLDLASGRATRITSGRMAKRLPRWSPDGRLIAYLGSNSSGGRGGQGVYIVPSSGGAPPRQVTTRVDRYISRYAWAPDGVSLLVMYYDGLAQPLAQVDVSTGVVALISPSRAVVGDIAASPGGASWIQSLDPNAATELRVQRRRAGIARTAAQVTPATDPRTGRRQEAVRWTNSRGEEIEGVVVYPVGYVPGRSYATIVDTYSAGSNARKTDEYNVIKVSSPYVVFRPNHRAPHMWMDPMKGASYDSAAAGPNGIAVMVDDIQSGVDTLVRRGIIDPQRTCVFGFSNGGLEGAQLLTQTARFRCAVLESPSIFDWSLTFFLSTDDPEVIRWMYGIAPWQDPALYTALIPLYQADKITTPVLLAVGDKETLRLLATIEMYNALRYLKKDVTLLRYPDQGHEFAGPAEADFEARMRTFFAKYLGK